ncbi:MAG: cbs domain containing protein [Bacteroidota bacterium]
MIPPLKMDDDTSKASTWMEELRLSELPVATDEKFEGFVIDELLIEDVEAGSQKIEDVQLDRKECFVYNTQHFYDVLKVASANGSKLVAVLDKGDKYLGVASIEDILEAFARTSTISGSGAILVIETHTRDYYLSEICRFIESTDAKVISSYVTMDPQDPSKLELTLKLNKEETSYAISILEANGYKVIESYSEATASVHEQERLDQLMNFLKL